jgi:hypothetical protein
MAAISSTTAEALRCLLDAEISSKETVGFSSLGLSTVLLAAGGYSPWARFRLILVERKCLVVLYGYDCEKLKLNFRGRFCFNLSWKMNRREEEEQIRVKSSRGRFPFMFYWRHS